jgi:acetylcholinesterase
MSLKEQYAQIFTSFNYRVSAFGFMYSKEIQAEKTGNFGLLDQVRILGLYSALSDNDPAACASVASREHRGVWRRSITGHYHGREVRIQLYLYSNSRAETRRSAGSISVAAHLVYGGETSTNLFRAGILESGTTSTWLYRPASAYQPSYDAIVKNTTCAGTSDSLACLRSLPVDQFIAATNRSVYGWGPVIDGVFLPEAPSHLLAAGKHVRVPLLLGRAYLHPVCIACMYAYACAENTDEGVSFGPKGINTNMDLQRALQGNYQLLSNASAAKILDLYPDDPFYGCPFNTGDTILPSGRQDKRSQALWGDLSMHAGVSAPSHAL